MTELEKWKAVNQCETTEQLSDLIIKFADVDGMIQGCIGSFPAEKMQVGLSLFMQDEMPAIVLTREFGIRQQAIYLKTFNK